MARVISNLDSKLESAQSQEVAGSMGAAPGGGRWELKVPRGDFWFSWVTSSPAGFSPAADCPYPSHFPRKQPAQTTFLCLLALSCALLSGSKAYLSGSLLKGCGRAGGSWSQGLCLAEDSVRYHRAMRGSHGWVCFRKRKDRKKETSEGDSECGDGELVCGLGPSSAGPLVKWCGHITFLGAVTG